MAECPSAESIRVVYSYVVERALLEAYVREDQSSFDLLKVMFPLSFLSFFLSRERVSQRYSYSLTSL